MSLIPIPNKIQAGILLCSRPCPSPAPWAVLATPFTVSSRKAERRFGYRPIYGWDEARERTQKWARSLDGA